MSDREQLAIQQVVYFGPLPSTQTRSGAHKASGLMDVVGVSEHVKRPEHEAEHSPQSSF